MGPRSDERGNNVADVKQRRGVASMGPRSDERGNCDPETPVAMDRFNGAALR